MNPTGASSGYHHGNLRAVLIETAQQMLEHDQQFSLRALARRAGVSPAAPYRHFRNRQELESALAVAGLRELMRDLTAASRPPQTASSICQMAIAYVHFAQRRPALFHLMFGQSCDTRDGERQLAAAALHEHLTAVMSAVYPTSDPAALATAGWSIAHGLAFLHLDGKLDSTDRKAVDDRVRAAVAAVFPPTDDISTH